MDTMRDWSSTSVLLIGVGGIGATLAPVLARLNPHSLTLQDDSLVGKENLTNQMFSSSDIGACKAGVLTYRLRGICDRIRAVTRRFTSTDMCVDDVVIAAVDSMESRRAIWKGVTAQESRTSLLLDGRLSRETPNFFHLFAISLQDHHHRQAYTEFLEGEGEPDTGRRDIDMISAPMVLSGVIVSLLVRWSRGRDLPWQIVYDGESMSIETFND